MIVGKSDDLAADAKTFNQNGRDRHGIISVMLHYAYGSARDVWRKLRSDRLAAQIKDGAVETAEYSLTRVSSERSSVYYFDKDSDREFTYVNCTRKSQATYFCTHYVVLSDDYYVEAVFVDFRYAGGREFLSGRIAAIRKALCPHVKCD